MRRPHRTCLPLIVLLAALAFAVGCSSEDVTGEPEDISELVHVDAAGSRCEHDTDADTARFVVRLENTGGDDRTVAITPLRRFPDGRDVGTSVDGFEITVPGGGSEEGETTVDDVDDDLDACLVQIDSGDPVEIARR